MNEFIPLILQLTAVVIVLAVAAQAVVAAVAAGRRLVQARETSAKNIELLDARVEAARRLQSQHRSEALSWQGFRKFKVERRVDEGGDVCSFYFRPHDDRSLPGFKPGQFLTCRFRIPGERNPTTRCYSLSSANHHESYRISVKRLQLAADGRIISGRVSSFVHDSLQEGDIVDIKAPSGNFYLDVTKNTPVVLIAGGVGLTPMLCMLEAIIQRGFQREVWLFYGVRNTKEQMMRGYLEAMHARHRRLRLRVCLSQPEPGDVEAEDFHIGERITLDLLKRSLPSNNYEFFVCGPPSMMEDLVTGLEQWGVPREVIKHEAFGPASVKTTAVELPPNDSGYAIEFCRSGKQLRWGAGQGSLLEFAEANGITINAGCRAGNCGTCLTAVREGEVKYLHEPGEALASGTCLVCVGVPGSDLVLDA